MNIQTLGWNQHFQEHFSNRKVADSVPARVIAEYRGMYLVHTGDIELQAEVTGALRYACEHESDFPKVGDFVAVTQYDVNKALIHEVLLRTNTLSRKKAGTQLVEQVLASNISVVCVVMGLDHDFNLRRLERYVALAMTMDCRLVIILNKADLVEKSAIPLDDVRHIAGAHSVFILSAIHPEEIEQVRQVFLSGDTVIFLGSSGVGKSTIINDLCGNAVQATNAVRKDDSHGRHTTTARQLFVIEPGISVIDTPGMRELQLWADDRGAVDSAFSDVEALFEHCRFGDCTHNGEPGCAVADALKAGTLSAERWQSYLKLCKERDYLRSKVDDEAFLARKEKERKLHKSIRKVLENKYGEVM